MYSVVCFGHFTCTYQYNRNITNQNETQDPGEEQKPYNGPPESLYNEQHCTQKTHKLSFLLLGPTF
jgi:hypothetical protein